MVKSMKAAILTPLALCALAAVSCGSAVGDAHRFVPNNPPVIGTVTQTMPDGSAVNRSSIVRGMSIAVTVSGHDPEGRGLTWSAVSKSGTATKPVVTAQGFSFVFVTKNVDVGSGVVIDITATDDRHASSSVTFDVGTGQTGTLVTLTPQGSTTISSEGSATFSFTASVKGYFETLCCDDEALVDSLLTGTRTVYDALDENGALAPASFTVRGADSTADGSLTLPDSQGAHTVWAVFYDQNGTPTKISAQVVIDDSRPDLIESTPSDGAADVAASTPIRLTFSKTVEPAALAGAVTVSCLSSEYTASLVSNTETSAEYSLDRTLPYSAECIVTVSGITDALGNVMAERRVCFTTASGPVLTYNANGATGEVASPAVFAAGTPVPLAEQDTLSKPYHTFGGWAASSDSEVPVSNPYTINGDTVLYAIWTKIPVISVSVPSQQICMKSGDTLVLTASVTGDGGAEADPALSWTIPENEPDILDLYSSYDPFTGTTENVMQATSPGTTRITATAWNGVYAECTVHVRTGSPLPKAMSLSLGETQTFTASAPGTVVWTSGDPAVVGVLVSGATVSITGKKKGTACVSAYYTAENVVTAIGVFPVTVTTVEAVSAGKTHTMILRSDGTVWTCGDNASGQLGRTISGTATSVIDKVDTSSMGPIAAVEAGDATSFVITRGNSLYGCGINENKELGLGSSSASKVSFFTKIMDCVTSVSAGSSHSLVMTAAGELFSFGNGTEGQHGDGAANTYAVPKKHLDFGTGTVKGVFAGFDSSFVLEQSSLYGFGLNKAGNLGFSSAPDYQLTRNLVMNGYTFTAAAAGSNFSLLLAHSASDPDFLYSCGSNTYGQLGCGSGTLSRSTPSPVAIPDGGTPASCAAGANHGLVLSSTGAVFGFGANSSGQIGNGSYAADVFEPAAISLSGAGLRAGAKAAFIAAGAANSFIITAEGELCAFGDNSYGQLCVPPDASGSYPAKITSPRRITLPADITW